GKSGPPRGTPNGENPNWYLPHGGDQRLFEYRTSAAGGPCPRLHNVIVPPGTDPGNRSRNLSEGNFPPSGIQWSSHVIRRRTNRRLSPKLWSTSPIASVAIPLRPSKTIRNSPSRFNCSGHPRRNGCHRLR